MSVGPKEHDQLPARSRLSLFVQTSERVRKAGDARAGVFGSRMRMEPLIGPHLIGATQTNSEGTRLTLGAHS